MDKDNNNLKKESKAKEKASLDTAINNNKPQEAKGKPDLNNKPKNDEKPIQKPIKPKPKAIVQKNKLQTLITSLKNKLNNTVKVGKKNIKLLYIVIAAAVLVIGIILTLTLTLTSSNQSSPSNAFDMYVEAYNSKDLNKLAAVIYQEDSDEYNAFIDSNSTYFDTNRLGAEEIEIREFNIVNSNERFAYANVLIKADDTQTYFAIFFRNIDGKWYLYSDIDYSTKSTEFMTIG